MVFPIPFPIWPWPVCIFHQLNTRIRSHCIVPAENGPEKDQQRAPRPGSRPSSTVQRRSRRGRLISLAGHHHGPAGIAVPGGRLFPHHSLSHGLPLQTAQGMQVIMFTCACSSKCNFALIGYIYGEDLRNCANLRHICISAELPLLFMLEE